jgi:hypothetical protein
MTDLAKIAPAFVEMAHRIGRRGPHLARGMRRGRGLLVEPHQA